MDGPDELWRVRKQFALQIAPSSFMTYTFSLFSRHPCRFWVSRATGLIAMTELLPGRHPHWNGVGVGSANIFTRQVSSSKAQFLLQAMLSPSASPQTCKTFWALYSRKASWHPVSWRLVDLWQNPRGTQSQPPTWTGYSYNLFDKFDLEEQLCLVSRDEVVNWFSICARPWTFDAEFRKSVAAHTEQIVEKAETMACKLERDNVSIYHLPLSAIFWLNIHTGSCQQWTNYESTCRSNCHQSNLQRHEPYSTRQKWENCINHGFDKSDHYPFSESTVYHISTCVIVAALLHHLYFLYPHYMNLKFEWRSSRPSERGLAAALMLLEALGYFCNGMDFVDTVDTLFPVQGDRLLKHRLR